MRKRIGELLIEAGLIDEYQLQSALGHQRQWGGRLGQILVHMNLVAEDKLVRVLSQQLGVAIAEPPADDLHVRVLGEISLELALQHHIFPLAIRRDPKGDQLAVAMTDPTNIAAIDAIQFTSGKKIVPLIAGGVAIESWIRRHYQGERVVQPSGTAATVTESSAQMSVQFGGQLIDLGTPGDDDDDIPVVTGAMVTAVVDPFASLAAMAAPNAVPTPSARFGAAPVAVPGVATSASFAGMGLATLDPLTSASDHDAWEQNVELPSPTPAAPTFGPSDGFLGADDDVGAAPMSTPLADPFASLPAPASFVADPFAGLATTAVVAEPVLELEVLDLTETAAVETPPPVAAPPTLLAPPSFVAPAQTPAPSWGDLLDVPAAATLDSLDIEIAVAPVIEAAAVEAAPVEAAAVEAEAVEVAPVVDNPFATAPVTADAFADAIHAPTSVEAPLSLDDATCPRCANARVSAARFCPFCGLSFVGVPLASGVVPVQSEFSGPSDLDIDINEPSGPTPRAVADVVVAAEAPVEEPIELPIDVVDDPIELPVEAIGLAAIEQTPPAVVAVDAPIELPVEALSLTAIDDVAPPLELSPDDIGLAAVAEPDDAPIDVVSPADDSSAEAASLAMQWADAAEKQIPRKASDTRNDLGWVPPSREIVVTPEAPPPAPEPIVAYTPAAPPVVTAPAAPWALFAPTLSPVEPKSEPPTAPAATDEAWVVSSSSSGPVPAAAIEQMEEAPVAEAPLAEVLVEPAEPAPLFAASIVDEQSLDLDISEVAGADTSDMGEPLEMIDDVIDVAEEPIALPAAAAPVDEPVAPPMPPVIGWGDMIDEPAPSLPAVVLPTISVPFIPPATLTPPPMLLTRTPTFDGVVAPAALSAPLVPQPTTWPAASHDDPFAASFPPLDLEVRAAEPAKPAKVTATMVMKLDPAEQRRLLEMLLANTEISADVLSQPPRPTDGDPDKGS